MSGEFREIISVYGTKIGYEIRMFIYFLNLTETSSYQAKIKIQSFVGFYNHSVLEINS